MIQFYRGMFLLKVMGTDGLLGMALVVRRLRFWDLWNLLFKLMFGLTEVPEARGGAPLDPAGGGVPCRWKGRGALLHSAPRPGEGIPGGRDQNHNSGNAPASGPTCAPLLHTAHFCRWYIPILNLRIREPSPLHTAMCRDRIKHNFNILFPSHNYWLHFPHLHHLARMLLMCLFILASRSPFKMSALQPSGHIKCMAY